MQILVYLFALFSVISLNITGQFLNNHYQAALTAIHTLKSELQVLQQELKFSSDDLLLYINKEKQYLEGLKAPPPSILRKIKYVQALNNLTQQACAQCHVFILFIILIWTCRKEWELACASINAAFTTPGFHALPGAINEACHNLDTAMAKMLTHEEYVGTLEIKFNIQEHWTSDTPEYHEYYQENVLIDYSRALDDLEHLVM